MTKTLADYISFHMRVQTYGSDMDAGRMAKAIKTEFELTDEEADTLGTFAMLFSCTESIDFNFDGTERKALIDFQRAWKALGKSPTARQVEGVRRVLPYAIMAAWIEAFHQSQSLFDVPIEQKPQTQLTEEERKEAENPSSPLAEPIAVGKLA